MNVVDQMLADIKAEKASPRQRRRPITAEWIAATQRIKALEAQIARHPKWQAFIAVTFLLIGGVIGRAIP